LSGRKFVHGYKGLNISGCSQYVAKGQGRLWDIEITNILRWLLILELNAMIFADGSDNQVQIR
jgi:hypothetical protein